MPQPQPRRRYQLYVGVDIAAASFTAVWHAEDALPPPARTFAQTAAGLTGFQQQLAATGVAAAETLVVLEATGSYWVALAVHLHAAGYVVSVVNPEPLHKWMQSLPRRSKTDPLDAQGLAQFALERCPPPWTPPPAIYHDVRQRLVARDNLLEMRQQARNQLHALRQWPVVVSAVEQQFEAVIGALDAQIRVLERDIAMVLADSAWGASAARLESIPGLGLITSAWILVATVHFTVTPTAEAAVGYAGLNPLKGQSGTSVRRKERLGRGGHSRLRTALYMATLSAAQHNAVIKTFYTRLRAAGKPMKVARCAAARKLLHLAFAVVTKEQDFDPSYQKLPSPVPVELAIAA
jgi:transposase